MNRRTRRTIIVTALLVLLLAGVVGELAFGDRGGITAAEAQTVVTASEANADKGLETSDRFGQSDDTSSFASSAVENNGPSPQGSNDVVARTPDLERGAGSGSSIPAPGASPVVYGDASTAIPVIASEDPGRLETPSVETEANDNDADESRGHGVDDHAVDHSDRHDESEAVSHGHDEEAHQEHHSNSHS